MNRIEFQKMLAACDNDSDFEKVIHMAKNDCDNNALNKDFYYYDKKEVEVDLFNSQKNNYYNTGYPKIDKYARPRASHITLIPAYTQHGKSIFSMNLCYKIWKNHKNKNIIYYSFEAENLDIMSFFCRLYYYEMNELDIKDNEKLISVSEWDRRIRQKTGEGALYDKFMYAVELFEKRIFIRNSRINAAQLDTHLRKVIDDKGNVGIVFIDYLQDMKPDKRTGEHHADIEQMMINVDKLASDYGVAIIIPAQYRSKDDKKKWHKEDIIGEHRIAGSSSLSKKADVIYSLFNTTVHDYQSNEIDKIGDTQEIEIDIIKTRKQSYAKNLTFQFNRRTGMIEESTKVIMPKVATK